MLTRHRKLEIGEKLEGGDFAMWRHELISDESINRPCNRTSRSGDDTVTFGSSFDYYRTIQLPDSPPITIKPLTNRLKIHAHKV